MKTRLERRFEAALDELKRAEEKLSRASTRWQKARKTVRRLELELERVPSPEAARELPARNELERESGRRGG